MSKYKFELTDRYVIGNPNHGVLEFNILIHQISIPHTLHIKVKYSCSHESVKTDSIKLNVGYAWQDIEEKAYLKGRFNFVEDREIILAMDDLKDILNQKDSNLNFSSKWRDFRYEFMDWYNYNIKPLLEEELEIFNKYAKNTSN